MTVWARRRAIGSAFAVHGVHAARGWPIALPLLLIGACATGLACSQAPGPANSASQIIRSETGLVVLPVAVTDRHGHSVGGLKEDDFRVYENAQPQSISLFLHEDVSVTVGLVIDSSASMGPKRGDVLEAAKDFLSFSNPKDEVFVVNFNEQASLGLPPAIPFTSDVSQLEAAVLKTPAAGRTALYDAIALALKHLASGTTDKKALLVITDGGDNASHYNFAQILTMAQHTDTLIYAIGIISESAAEVNPKVLRKLASATGGQVYFPDSAAKLPAICRQIARDLRDQYTIAYVPSNKAHDGTFRAIRVSLLGPQREDIVRTRKGYFAASDVPADTGKGTAP